MTTALQTLTNKLAERFDMGDGSGLTETLKASAFAGSNVNDAQMVALLVIANQYQLNPWTKEIYAFPGGSGGITPIVGVDGWIRIINREPQYDGMEFSFSEDYSACTCTIYRKDRSKPIIVTEFLHECLKPSSPAWKSHPKRMLRHKAMIQCARLAFGFTGIYDQDEAERIEEGKTQTTSSVNAPSTTTKNTNDGNPAHPEFEGLVSTLEDIAKQGMPALESYWKQSINKEQRAIVGMNELARIKLLAQQYEQGTMQDAEYTEA